tara:strand:- start:1429 stop:3756 length:2328 start_codon:yes stop_codon:yes gene_type:complete
MGGAAPTLESNYWFGAQGNRLWAGQVEGDGYELIDTGEPFPDPDESNRVKVRIMGYHTRSRSRLPSRDLPWATIMMPNTITVNRKNKGTVHGLENGVWVIGTFLDGESAQQPLVLGSIGITDKNQTFEDRIESIGGTNNNNPNIENLKSNSGTVSGGPENPTGIGVSGRGGGPRSEYSNDDLAQLDNEKVVVGVANGKCGNRPENEIARILQDLFKFVSRNDRIGDLFVDKLTGNITKSINIVYSYVGRLLNTVNGLLGDIKALVVSEVKKYIQKAFAALIATIQTPTGRGAAVTVAGKVFDVIFEAIKCLFQTLLDKVSNLILDIITTLLDDVLNTAFCQVSNILKGITSEIQNGIQSGLQAISAITSGISELGNFGGAFIAKIGNLIAQFCDGDLACTLGITEVQLGVGPKPDNAIDTFFDRLETFGDLPNDLNVGLYGSDSFLSSLQDIEIRDSSGNIVRGSLDCSRATEFKFPMIPNLFFTGLQTELNRFKFNNNPLSLSGSGGSGSGGSGPGVDVDDFTINDLVNDDPYPPTDYDGVNSGPGSNDPTPRGIPVINRKGVIIGGKVTNPGFDLINPPDITISPNNDWGSGAEGETRLNDKGGVHCIVITKGGGGYPYFDKSVSTANFVSTLEDGSPNYAKINVIYSENPFWLGAILKKCPPFVKSTGFGYSENCIIVVEPGPGEENDVVLPELKPIFSNGFLTGVEVEKEGFGFTVPPIIYISCGGGNLGNQRKAEIIPVLEFFPRKDASKFLSNYNEFKTIIDCVGHPGD